MAHSKKTVWPVQAGCWLERIYGVPILENQSSRRIALRTLPLQSGGPLKPVLLEWVVPECRNQTACSDSGNLRIQTFALCQ